MKYTYKARTKEGNMETGSVEANSREAAALLLQKYNIFVTSLEEQGGRKSFLKRITLESRVSKKDLAIFFRQLSVMLQSRVPVVQSLASLAVQTGKKNFKEIILKIASLVEEGTSLSDALAAYPHIFDSFYINLVKSGELSGNISGSLAYISEHVEQEDDTASQLRQAMVYPMIVVAVLFIVIAIVIVEVMPRIADLIKESNTKPSFFTSTMITLYQFLQHSWWIIALLLFFLITLTIYYFKTKEGKRNYDTLSLKVPLLGGLLKKIFVARFCGNVATLVSAGISINSALRITADTVSNHVYKNIIAKIEREVSEGEKISFALAKYDTYFSPFVVQMVKVGEETGKLDKTLMEVVGFYQKEIKGSIGLFSSLFQCRHSLIRYYRKFHPTCFYNIQYY